MPTLEDVKSWPATFIRWYGAKAYVIYYGYDLPTEAQWEYAAKTSMDYQYATADGNVNEDGTSANWNWAHEEPALHHVYDVFINNPNPFGLYNMAGNVWEWVEDWYKADFYTDGVTDPLCTDTSSNKKVRRGGSWNYHKATLKGAARFEDERFKGNDHFGFRVVSNTEVTSFLENDVEIPSQFSLYQNYPNPFNPVTKIKFSVGQAFQPVPAQSVHTTLRIYNSLGAEITTLVNELKSPGTYETEWNATGIASGIYFCEMKSGGYSKIMKLILIK